MSDRSADCGLRGKKEGTLKTLLETLLIAALFCGTISAQNVAIFTDGTPRLGQTVLLQCSAGKRAEVAAESNTVYVNCVLDSPALEHPDSCIGCGKRLAPDPPKYVPKVAPSGSGVEVWKKKDWDKAEENRKSFCAISGCPEPPTTKCHLERFDGETASVAPPAIGWNIANDLRIVCTDVPGMSLPDGMGHSCGAYPCEDVIPTDVPAKSLPATKACAKYSTIQYDGNQCDEYVDVPHWTCEDKRRTLLTSEDGMKHCVRFPN